MMAIDDDRLMAYLDNELDAAARAEVEQALAGDDRLRAQLEGQRKLRQRLAMHYDPVADEPVPPRLRAMLDDRVVDLAVARAQRHPLWQSLTALAASLVLGIAVGRMVPGVSTGPVVVEDRHMMAQGALAEALDTQLASTQPRDAATRIGVSFVRADGAWCRTFDSAALAGLACRGDGGWQVMMTAAGTAAPQTEYRQAGSNALLVMQAAQEMMADEPVDAAAEQQARDSGWQRRR